jgi:hypothetical protein
LVWTEEVGKGEWWKWRGEWSRRKRRMDVSMIDLMRAA